MSGEKDKTWGEKFVELVESLDFGDYSDVGDSVEYIQKQRAEQRARRLGSMTTPTPEEYQRLKAEGKSDEAIAQLWGFATRDAVYNRLKKWRKEGKLPPKETK